MKHFYDRQQQANHQNGAALLVAMIMIFMLSIMGVSSMRGSTLERRMATNSIQTATTFQAAESASEIALNNEDNMTDALNSAVASEVNSGTLSDTAVIEIAADLQQDIGLDSKSQLRYIGDGPAYGYSTDFVAYRFEVIGRAEIEAVRADAQVTQGAYRIAPAP